MIDGGEIPLPDTAHCCPIKARKVTRAAIENGHVGPAVSRAGLKNGRDFTPRIPAAEETLLTRRASDIAPANVSWLWQDRFPHRRLSVLTGPPGLGKSQIATFLAATVTTGRDWPDGSPCSAKGFVIILSAEDDIADTIVPRLRAAGADCDKVEIVMAVNVQPKGGRAQKRNFDLTRDLEQLEILCAKYDATLVIIDPISAYCGKGSDSHNNTDVRGLLAPLAALAANCGTAVVAITHDRKGGGSASERTMGSIAFIAAPRAVWAVTPEVSEAGEPTARNVLTMIKSNLSRNPGGLAYEIEERRISSDTEPNGITTSRIKWHSGVITKTADQLYAASAGPAKQREAPAFPQAAKVLRDLLANGPRPVKEIEADAKAAGFSSMTIRRAREKIGIRCRKIGFSPAVWHWELPTQSPEDAEDDHLAETRVGVSTFEDAQFP
jgi:putative DNA primase/helicase